jgi:hypothetical protein
MYIVPSQYVPFTVSTGIGIAVVGAEVPPGTAHTVHACTTVTVPL